MKKVFFIFSLLSTMTSYSQDFEMLNFINIYRINNGCESLIYSEHLEKIAKINQNVGQQSSAVMYWNGRLENIFATHALDNNLGNEMNYAFKEFSWYLQGSHFDDANCAELAKEMIDESGGELMEVDLLRDAYLFRGLVTKAKSL